LDAGGVLSTNVKVRSCKDSVLTRCARGVGTSAVSSAHALRRPQRKHEGMRDTAYYSPRPAESASARQGGQKGEGGYCDIGRSCSSSAINAAPKAAGNWHDACTTGAAHQWPICQPPDRRFSGTLSAVATGLRTESSMMRPVRAARSTRCALMLVWRCSSRARMLPCNATLWPVHSTLV
jgi:hypothetical protein